MLELLTFIADGIAINNCYYQIEEIKSGKTTNKIWLSLTQFYLNFSSIATLSQVLPELSDPFSYLKYALYGLIALANYLCYVFESNDIALQNQSQQAPKTLPFDLQNNQNLKTIAKFISNNINFLHIGIYTLALGLALYYGLTEIILFNIVGIFIEQIYQRNILHRHVATVYRMFQMVLLTGLLFGFDNWIFMAINLITTGFMIGDHLLTHLFGVTTASIQFPIARKSNQFILSENKPHNRQDLQLLLDKIKEKSVEVTFDHMRQGALLDETISQPHADANYDDYLHLFSKIDFNNSDLQGLIEAEITANDDFMRLQPQEHIERLKLPVNTSNYQIIIAYLKQEMIYMVERLKSNAPRNLNHEQIAMLKGHGQLILKYLQTLDSKKDIKFSLILIELALRTGSHCSRVYIESFANILRNNHVCDIETLDLKSQILLKAHRIKSEAFFGFYQRFIAVIKMINSNGQNQLIKHSINLFWSDNNDYHTYEGFCQSFGSNLYLDNQTLSVRLRGITDIAMDIYWNFLLAKAHPLFLFSSHYSVNFLISCAISGKLSPEFKQWCEIFYPKAYEDFGLDDDLMVDINNPNMIALATLMLLDCNIIQFKKPYSPDSSKTPTPGFYERLCDKYHGLLAETIEDTLKKI